MKLYSAIYNSFYPFDQMDLFSDYQAVSDPEELTEKGALVVWGGEDISPSLYNKAVSRYTRARDVPSRRDQIEWNLMVAAKSAGMPIIGICRGAQMLCALNGGFLIQDVSNHCRAHSVTTSTGDSFQVSSLHHQMLYPFEVEHKLLAWATNKLSKHYLDVDTQIEVTVEPECVLFPQPKGLAIQWHPEFLDYSDEAQQYVYNLVKEIISG